MYQFPENINTARHDSDVAAILARIERLGLPADPVAFYGSSSFRQWQSMAEDLGSLDVLNLGFGGGTFLSALHYLDRLLIPARPSKIALLFGENDIANDGLTAERTADHLDTLLDRIGMALPGATVFVCSAKRSPGRWIYVDEIERYNALAQSICRKRGIRWVDMGSCLMGENGRPMARHFLPDQIHLTPSGYSLWAGVLRQVQGLLEEVKVDSCQPSTPCG